MTLPLGRLRSRLARLEGGNGGVRMLRMPLHIADDPETVAASIVAHRAATGWRGRLALIAVPDNAPNIEAWALAYGPATGSA